MADRPPLLKVRVREVLRGTLDEAPQRQIAEVMLGDEVLGQLPFTRVTHELLPNNLSKLAIELIVDAAEVSTHG